MQKIRVASRYLLPTESLMALQAIAWAISGGLGHGRLWRILELRGENAAWLVLLGGVGLAICMVCALEWFLGRAWPVSRVLASVSLRAVGAFLMTAIWCYALYVVLVYDPERSVFVLTMMAPLNAGWTAWCFHENLKVRYALEPRYATTRLHFHR